MAVRLSSLDVDSTDPVDSARFWQDLLGWANAGGGVLTPTDDTGFDLRFVATERAKATQNRMHFDLTSASPDAQAKTVARALASGGRRVDVGQRPDETHVVLGDPEGNEFCVIAPGNTFLAGCGFVGALACEGSRQVGYFWSEVLGWPLVWDQDEETAIRSPAGGPKITWGGSPVMPKDGPNRLRFALTADDPTDVDRLVSFGAVRVGPQVDGYVAMTDPDGNEFTVRIG